MTKKLISIVVPCYNEEPTLEKFYAAITKISREMSEVDFEMGLWRKLKSCMRRING